MKKIPMWCLVDTNVAIVANGKSKQADDSLVEKCIDAVLKITSKGGSSWTRGISFTMNTGKISI